MHPELPSEVLLYIFAFLPLPSVASVHLVCSNWHHLIDSHANFVYRSIYLSGLPTPSFLLDAPDSLSSIVKSKTWLRGTTSWRELARRVRVLARNWSEANAEGQWLFLPSNDVWRMVYDPVEGSVVCSTRRGGIYSFDERTSLLLWTLPDVRSHSHIEFSNGYFVHDVGDGLTHVVYRRTRDMLAEGALEEDGVATTSSSTRRGHYSFYARLTSPSPIRAYRFVGDKLLVGGMDATQAWIFHVPSKRLIAMFNITSFDLDLINYVEITNDHILIAGLRFIHIHYTGRIPTAFAFPTVGLLAPPISRILDFPSSPATIEFVVDLALDFYPTVYGQPDENEEVWGKFGSGSVPVKRAVVQATATGGERRDVFSRSVDYNFKAVHVSDGNLIAVTLLGKIFILLDYPVVFANPTLESDHLISLDVEEPVYNLAFAEGRAVFTTKSKCLYLPMASLPSLDDLRRARSPSKQDRPPLSLVLFQFADVSPVAAHETSCIQIDDTRILLSYFAKADPWPDYLSSGYSGHAPPEARKLLGFAIKVFNFSALPSQPIKSRRDSEGRLQQQSVVEDDETI